MLRRDQQNQISKRKGRKAKDPIPFTGIPVAFTADPALKPSWGLLLFAGALIVLPIWGLVDARNYFQNYFSSPMGISESDLSGIKTGNKLIGTRVEVALPPLKDSGISTVILQSLGDSQLEQKVGTENTVKLLPIGSRFLVVLREPEKIGIVSGAMVSPPKDLKGYLARAYHVDNYDDLFEPYCLDELAYRTNGPYWVIFTAILSIAGGVYLMNREIKRVKKVRLQKKEEDKIILQFSSSGD